MIANLIALKKHKTAVKKFIPISVGTQFYTGQYSNTITELKDDRFVFSYWAAGGLHYREVTFDYWYYNAYKVSDKLFMDLNSSRQDTLVFDLKRNIVQL